MHATQSEERHIICKVRSKTTERERVKSLLLECVGPARGEPGCLYYHLYQQIDDPDTFYLLDGWASDAAVVSHTREPIVLSVIERMTPLLVEKPVLTTSVRLSEP